jgi:hypothetical protein
MPIPDDVRSILGDDLLRRLAELVQQSRRVEVGGNRARILARAAHRTKAEIEG